MGYYRSLDYDPWSLKDSINEKWNEQMSFQATNPRYRLSFRLVAERTPSGIVSRQSSLRKTSKSLDYFRSIRAAVSIQQCWVY